MFVFWLQAFSAHLLILDGPRSLLLRQAKTPATPLEHCRSTLSLAWKAEVTVRSHNRRLGTNLVSQTPLWQNR